MASSRAEVKGEPTLSDAAEERLGQAVVAGNANAAALVKPTASPGSPTKGEEQAPDCVASVSGMSGLRDEAVESFPGSVFDQGRNEGPDAASIQ